MSWKESGSIGEGSELLAACALQSPSGVKDEEVQDNASRCFHLSFVRVPLLSQLEHKQTAEEKLVGGLFLACSQSE